MAIKQAKPKVTNERANLQYPREKYGRERYIIFICRKFTVKHESEPLPTINSETVSSIKLYVPNDFTESISQNWGAEGLFAITELADIQKHAGVRGLKNIAQKLLGDKGVAEAKKKYKQIINPKEELLYQGPNFRTIPFTFEFMPKNKEEVQEVRRILMTFKKYSLPVGALNAATLGFPSLWNLKVAGGSKFTDMGWKDKHFALTDMTINYTPEGEYLTFEDGFPVKTTLTLTFQETQVLYQDDITII